RHFLVRMGIDDDIRQCGVGHSLAMSVLLANRPVDDRTLAVVARERADDVVDGILSGTSGAVDDRAHLFCRRPRSAEGPDGEDCRGAHACGPTRHSARASAPPCPDSAALVDRTPP